MKQIIPFVKDLNFNTRISEITSIALEHNLKLENNDSVVGNFEISGKYKINDISVNEEVFSFDIPFDITLDDKYDASKIKIDIDNFYYEILNDEVLRVHIDVLASNLVYYRKVEEEKEETSNLEEESLRSNDSMERKVSMPEEVIEKKEEVLSLDEEEKNENKEVREKEDDTINSNNISNNLEKGFLFENEKYSTYKVHIVRENETIDTIKEMYNVSLEELEKYNDVDKITLSSKVVIPIEDE